jgi:YcxB-like protein
MITLRYRLRSEDYIKAQYLHMKTDLRPRLLLFLGTILFYLFFLFAISPFEFSASFIPNSLTSWIFVIFGMFYLFLFPFLALPWYARRTFSQRKTLRTEHEAVISPEMIEITSEYGLKRMHLSPLYTYKVCKTLILLYGSPASFHIFPRRFFPSEENYKTFLSYLEANLGNPKPYQ